MMKQCEKCKADMETGFVVDFGEGNARMQEQWVAGYPEKSFWTGLNVGDKQRYRIMTYRCVKCGYLESYATVVVDE